MDGSSLGPITCLLQESSPTPAALSLQDSLQSGVGALLGRSPADQARPLRGAAGAHRTQTVRTRGRARGAVKLPRGDPERSRQTLRTDPWDLPVPPQGPSSLHERSSSSMPGSLFWSLVSA